MRARHIIGYAVKWHQPAWIRSGGGYDGFEERFARGAFAESIAAGRVRLCIGHDWHQIVARQADGSLRLTEDHVGLLVEADALDNETGDRALALVRGRGFTGLSVSFGQAVSIRHEHDDIAHRMIRRCRLHEVSIVHEPAHRSSEVYAGRKSIARFLASYDHGNRLARLAAAEEHLTQSITRYAR